MTLANEILDWVTSEIDEGATLIDSEIFPSIYIIQHQFSLLVISLTRWKLSNLPDDFLENFINSRRHERWIIIWEDIWIRKGKIVRDRLRSFAGISERIHGRQCSVEMVSVSECEGFLNENHLMGYTKARYRLALKQKREMMAIATFGRAVPVMRNGKTVQSHELIRFCHRKGLHVSGGLSKLLSHFRQLENPEDIFTSVDREWSSGEGYSRIGFNVIGESRPLCFYLDEKLNRHRKNNGKLRICNAGNIRMALTYK